VAKQTTTVDAVNAEALELITGTCRERVNEMLDDLLEYVKLSGAAGSLTLKIQVTPDSTIPDAYAVSIVPALSVKGLRSEGAAQIEKVGRQLQLRIAGME
jgi:hypothetical protein